MSALVLTVGYANRSVQDLIALMKRESVQFLIDVRSNPLSKFKPEFSRGTLEPSVRSAGIRYVYMGDLLGGRPQDPSCYENGHVIYSVVQQKAFFRKGIDRLIDAHSRGLKVSLMCSEARPEDCHRSKLIGFSLAQRGVDVMHLGPEGQHLSQADVIARLNTTQVQLFGDDFCSRNAYPFMARRTQRRE
jgi:uncharacterized protein (DUF488 family)